MSNYPHDGAKPSQGGLPLAEDVRCQLKRAGIPAFVDGPDQFSSSGAAIEVDQSDDDGGAVFVRWQLASDLEDEAADAVAAGRYEDPALTLAATIAEAMVVALRVALSASGFAVGDVHDDLRPFSLSVLGRRDSVATG